jgi:hypothetical protein
MNLVLLIIFLVISSSFGIRILKLVNFKFSNFKEMLAFSLPLGLGLMAYFVYAIGLMGFLHRKVILSLLLLLALFSFREIIFIIRKIKSYLCSLKPGQLTLSSKVFMLFIFFILMLTLAGALAPPTGNDSLAYRLSHIQLFSKSHKVFYIPYTRESLWPYLVEMLFGLAIIVKSDIFAKLIAWSMGLIGVFSIYVFSRKFFSKKSAYISALVFLLTPAIFTQMTYTYTDIAIAVYCFMSLFALVNCFKYHDIKWAALSGLYSGLFLSIKYISLITLPSIVFIFMYYFITDPKQRRFIIRSIFVFVIFTMFFFFSWYLRAYLIKGNPLYPFFARYFNFQGWDRALDKSVGVGFSIFKFLQLPWNITMFPSVYGGEHLGVMYLIFLPLSILSVKHNRNLFIIFAIFSVLFAMSWFFVVSASTRFLFPVLLPLSVIIGCGVADVFVRRGYFNNVVKGIFIAICIFNLGYLAYYAADKVKVATGIESRQEYLQRTERSFGIGNYINKNLPEDAKILMIGEIRAYYMNRPYIHLNNLLDEDKINPSELSLNELKNKYDLSYILYSKKDSSYSWFDPLLKRKTPIYTCDFFDREQNAHISYMLYDLQDSQ